MTNVVRLVVCGYLLCFSKHPTPEFWFNWLLLPNPQHTQTVADRLSSKTLLPNFCIVNNWNLPYHACAVNESLNTTPPKVLSITRPFPCYPPLALALRQIVHWKPTIYLRWQFLPMLLGRLQIVSTLTRRGAVNLAVGHTNVKNYDISRNSIFGKQTK